MKVSLRMEQVSARVLEAPEVQYANISERPAIGAWNLRDRRILEGAVLRNWGVVISATCRENEVGRFVQVLCDAGRKCGMDIQDSDPVVVDMRRSRGNAVEGLMTKCSDQMKQLAQSKNSPPQLIMVIKQDATRGQYGDIKRFSDLRLSIPSQCIVAKHVGKANAQYCANVCLKINMKLRGKNSVLTNSLPVVSSAPTIITGAEVSHPRSGMDSRSSIASVVASLDRYSAKYVARVCAQKSSNANVHQLPLMLRDLFLVFYQHTQYKPEHIIYYRDGVSDGQFADILHSEMIALHKACKMLSEDYAPPVTFIVVNKRHHTRTFAVNKQGTDRSGNVQPGTVIDQGIVDTPALTSFCSATVESKEQAVQRITRSCWTRMG